MEKSELDIIRTLSQDDDLEKKLKELLQILDTLKKLEKEVRDVLGICGKTSCCGLFKCLRGSRSDPE